MAAHLTRCTKWPCGKVPDIVITTSPVQISHAAMYQCQLNMPSLCDQLMITSKGNGHTMQCTGPVSVVIQIWLASGWGLQKRRSMPPRRHMRLGKDITFSLDANYRILVGVACKPWSIWIFPLLAEWYRAIEIYLIIIIISILSTF